MQEYLSIPGFLPIQESAKLMGLSDKRVLQFVLAHRLPAKKVQGRYLIPIEALESFQQQPHGRIRTQPVVWRKYRAGALVYLRHINAPILLGCNDAVREWIADVAEQQSHCFPGTMQRFISVIENRLDVVLIWKSTEANEEAIASNVAVFKAACADLVNWSNARDETSKVVAHT